MNENTRAWAPELPGAHARFTTVEDGNLALHVGDDPANVAANRAALREECGRPVLFVNQVHSVAVATIRTRADVVRIGKTAPDADALVTDRSDIAIAMMVADCVPIVCIDPEAGVIGAIHAGRRGLLDGVIAATIESMESIGADPLRIHAAVGPCVCGLCYEVPAEMKKDAREVNPSIAAETSWGTPALDLEKGAHWALTESGINAAHIRVSSVCTFESEAHYSYRRDPKTGRFAGIIALAAS